MTHITNSLNWFEIPVANFERARRFYSTIYDNEMLSADIGKNKFGFFPVQHGHIGGAIIYGEGHEPSTKGTLVYLNGGEDLNTIYNRIEAAGGQGLQQKTAISPEHGYFALFLDTEGNRVALHSMH
jgi:hypothetical protein